MKTCANCGAQLNDEAEFCTQCGAAAAPAGAQQTPPPYNQQYQNQYQNPYQNQYQYQQPVISPYDHTAEFDQADISNNKCYCMLVYLSGIIGIIVALLGSGADRSPYINFHVRQAIKFFVIQTLSTMIMAVLAITIIIPIAGCIWLIILWVLEIIAFVQVCMGQAKEPAIIRAFPFLR